MPDHLPAADGPARDAAIELARGADVLIHDSQFVTAEHILAEAYGHSTQAQAIELAVAAGVGELVLFHHAPGRTDDELELLFDDLASGAFRTAHDHPRSRGRRVHAVGGGSGMAIGAGSAVEREQQVESAG